MSKGDIRSGGFDLNGLWSPWYTLHKTFAGLRDAYRHTGNRSALDVETRFATWAEGVLAPLSEAQVQKMLLTEHGGMNEVLADLYADTGDKRWLELSYTFEHHAFTDALKRPQDNLNGKHGNCQIPKLIGSAARYGYTGDAGDIQAASFFWDRVVQHHSYATGGHGLAEYFGPPDQLSTRVDGRTCESCNEYNMLKLTRRLFAFRPDAFYADYHERALFNHVLASIDPEDGRTSYMVPVGRGVQQEYQDMQQSFTCCVGSGMESHALHGDGLYYESGDTLWVNLFVPSTAQFVLGNVGLRMDTGFPDGETAAITLTMPAQKAFTLAVRRPSWAGDGFTVKVNGASVEVPPATSLRAGGAGGRGNGMNDAVVQPGSYVELRRTWKSGDTVELTLPKSLHLEPTPDNKQVTAIMWGPLVLAGDLGARREGRGAGPARACPGARRRRPTPDRLDRAGPDTSGGFPCAARGENSLAARVRPAMCRSRRSTGRTAAPTACTSTCSRRRISMPGRPRSRRTASARAGSRRRRWPSHSPGRCSPNGTSTTRAILPTAPSAAQTAAPIAPVPDGSRSTCPSTRPRIWPLSPRISTNPASTRLAATSRYWSTAPRSHGSSATPQPRGSSMRCTPSPPRS